MIVLVGPTAVGKTDMSIKLAKYFDTEIISADSRQFYREMNVGTAKPSLSERGTIPHHFIDSHSIHDIYSAGDFEREALATLKNIFKEKNVAVVVGGSGLFVKALCEGLDDLPQPKEGIREYWNCKYQNEGIKVLQKHLASIDPEYYEEVELENPQRLIRAIEVFETSGKPFSYYRKNKTLNREFKVIPIGLNMDRQELYDRINKRVDKMLEDGLLDEAKGLLANKQLPALITVGYSEIFDYYEGKISKEVAIERIKQNTRRYAKRQITWFKKMPDITWFYPNDEQGIISHINSSLG